MISCENGVSNFYLPTVWKENVLVAFGDKAFVFSQNSGDRGKMWTSQWQSYFNQRVSPYFKSCKKYTSPGECREMLFEPRLSTRHLIGKQTFGKNRNAGLQPRTCSDCPLILTVAGWRRHCVGVVGMRRAVFYYSGIFFFYSRGGCAVAAAYGQKTRSQYQE